MNILFIGNSYTFDLPETIAALAEAHGETFSFEAITKGGWKLRQHAEAQQTLSKIRSGDWDYVVLQEQSQLPAFAESQRATEMYPYAMQLHEAIKKTAAQTLFYLTWAHDKGDRRNFPDDSFSSMQQRLNEGYENIAAQCAAAVVPVGKAWATARQQDAAVNLYQSDGSHPNPLGVYLNACVFFRFLFKNGIQSGLTFADNGLSEAESHFLAGIANSLSV